MKEQEFLEQLDNALRSLPVEQREDILVEYRSHFFEAKGRGKSEEAIAAGFGDPKAIAHTYVADYHINQWQVPSSGQSLGKSVYHLLRGVIVIFSLLFFNFFFMLWPIIGIAVLLMTAWIMAALSTLLSLFLAIVGVFGGISDFAIANASTQFALIFYALGTGVVGVLTCLALYSLSRWFVSGVLRYVKMNINLVAA